MADEHRRPHPHNFIDRTGRRHGSLVVLEYGGNGRWICRCDCGKTTLVLSYLLTSGQTRSCGCGKGKTTHGGFGHPLYRTWFSMTHRCHNPNAPGYRNYGGRGIRVCDAWRNDPNRFYADVPLRPGPGYSIDRIDNDRGYEPGNVRWATNVQQGRNRRTNRLIAFRGETRCLMEWADRLGFTHGVLSARMRAGWDVEKMLTTPVDRRFSHAGRKRRREVGQP